MEKYVEKLINHIQTSCLSDNKTGGGAVQESNAYNDNPQAEEQFFPTLAELMGINPEVFPAVAKLSDTQTERLTAAVLALWKSYSIEAVYPEDFPSRLLYPLLIAKFKDFRVSVSPSARNKPVYVEFCDYNYEHCPFGRKYCQICWDEGVEQEMIQA